MAQESILTPLLHQVKPLPAKPHPDNQAQITPINAAYTKISKTSTAKTSGPSLARTEFELRWDIGCGQGHQFLRHACYF